ncbi:NAD(P)-binding domain-containing protein [Streptomyces sp. NPDC046261]|uniref:NAD(P)-dependent oxidoreductase n=1 Tax=Streptomyces sp. NPDC046261 TaxID=3157200 RepID=UPI0033E1035D
MNAKVTVLGLGPVGTALAEAFLAAGHRTTVWAGTPGWADALAGRGAVEAGSAAEAVAASPLVVIRMGTYEAVREVLDPVAAAGGLGGRCLVNLTPGSPPHARAAADWARRHGADYLDGAVMTTSPPGIGNPDFPVLYSGSRPAFDGHREVLAALGEPVHLGTDTALASVYDTALLGLMWAALAGWLHGAALVGADGPGGNETAAAFTEVADRWLKTVSGLMRSYAPQVDSGQYPGGELTLHLHRSAMDLLIHASELRGVASDLPELLRELSARAIEAGHGDDSYARLVEVMRKNVRP